MVGGIRILRQDFFETVISYIISANNNIPRIKKNINDISKKYGNKIEYKSKIYYSFPSPKTLSEAKIEDLKNLKLRF